MKKMLNKKVLGVLLAVMMLFSLAAPAFATGNDSGTVTVYVTSGRFTSGGVDANGPIPQAFIPGAITSSDINPYFYINAYEISIDDVADYADYGVTTYYYNPPTTFTNYPNVVDAIIFALLDNGFDDITAGWDANPSEGNPGGYIHSVYPQPDYYSNAEEVTAYGVDYYYYHGNGWNIACTQNGTIAKVPDYGTSIALVDGMTIVFDISNYSIYEER